MSAERWLHVVGYEDRYEVSDHGNVRSTQRGWATRERRPYRNPEGYLRVQLHQNKRVKTFSVHRLVLMAFRGPCPEGLQGCHNDGDKGNNHLSNLRWDTPSANTRDQVRHGVHNMASKDACDAGHPLEGANVYHVDSEGRRGRHCRTCRSLATRRRTLRISPPIVGVGLTHAQLRQWARDRGLAVPLRGAIPRSVITEYLADAS